jgi:tetratricopeptide (TPR) repeat protein
LSGAFIVAGQHESALEQARLGLELAEPIRDAYSVAGLASNAGEACYYLGRLDEAERFALQSLRQEEDSQRPYALTVLGFVRRDQARWSEAESVLKEAIKTAQANQDPFAEASAWRALGVMYERQSAPEAASAAMAEAHRLSLSMGL